MSGIASASVDETALTLSLASLDSSFTGTSVIRFDWHHETASHPSQIRSPESKSPVLQSKQRQSFLFSSNIDWLTQQKPHPCKISKNPDVRADSSPLYLLSNTLGASCEEWQMHTLFSALFCFSYSNITHMLDTWLDCGVKSDQEPCVLSWMYFFS